MSDDSEQCELSNPAAQEALQSSRAYMLAALEDAKKVKRVWDRDDPLRQMNAAHAITEAILALAFTIDRPFSAGG